MLKRSSDNRLNGGQVIVDYLIREKVPYAFGLCGHGNIQFIDALHERQSDIKTISVHHESVCGFMADAYYRVKGQPVATFTTCGPGSMNLPFSAQAIEAGMKSLGRTVDLLGPYQAGGAFVLRSWAKANPEILERYLAGYIESLRWVVDKNNRDEAIALLMSKRNLSRSLATRSYDLMIEPGFGFNPDAKLSVEGFNNVLALRQEIEGGPPPSPAKYLDLSYYDRALKLVK